MRIIKTTERKANKIHTCDFCHGDIQKGEVYSNQTNKYDGELYTWKSHLICVEFIFSREDICGYEGVSGDTFRDYIIEIYRDLEPENYLDVEFEDKYNRVIEAFKNKEI